MFNVCKKLFFLLFNTILSTDFQNPCCWKSQEIENFLKFEPIINIETIDEYFEKKNKTCNHTQDVFIVHFKNNIKGVFKDCSEQIERFNNCGEVIAYTISCYLEFPYIPTTVYREINGIKGSLQLFVEGEEIHKENLETVLQSVDEDQKIKLKIFNFIFGQWDTWPGNFLLKQYKGKNYIISIDNECILNIHYCIYGQTPFVRCVYSENLDTNNCKANFFDNEVCVIHNPTSEKLKKIFGSQLPQSFYNTVSFYGNNFYYVIYDNALWRNHYYEAKDGKDFILSYVPYITDEIRERIENLNFDLLKKIYTINNEIFSSKLFSTILDRKNQVLNGTKKIKIN